jgi:hypothetical protein
MRWRPVGLVLAAALAGGACLGGLPHDPAAEAITLSPRAALDLPLHQNRAYWLLRAAPGWRGAHEVRYGGDPGEPAVFVVRAARFDGVDATTRAFARLTPAYLFLAYRDRMRAEPEPFVYPAPLPGDQLAVTAYELRLPGDEDPENVIYGQMTAIRSGTTILLIESVGVQEEKFVPAVAALVRTAERGDGAGR